MLIFRFLTVSKVKAISDRPKNATKIAIAGNSGVAGDELVVDFGVEVDVDDVERLVIGTSFQIIFGFCTALP